jgi:hypothetical protein
MPQATVVLTKMFDDIFLAPQKSTTYWWTITQSSAWWFYAVPRVPQTSFPQTIHIDRVQISTTESTKFRAYIKIVNDNSPQPPDFPWQDGCHFSLYAVSASV